MLLLYLKQKKTYNSAFSLLVSTSFIRVVFVFLSLMILYTESSISILARSDWLYVLMLPLRFHIFYLAFRRPFASVTVFPFSFPNLNLAIKLLFLCCWVRYTLCSSGIWNLYFRLYIKFWMFSLLCCSCSSLCRSSVFCATLWLCCFYIFYDCFWETFRS